jgi:hypothetical protein
MTENARIAPKYGEDEDLFHFPTIELTLEGLRDGSVAGAPSVVAPLPSDAGTAARPHTPSTILTPPDHVAPAFKHVEPAPALPATHTPISSPPADVPGPSRTRPVLLVASLMLLFALNGVGFWYLWRTRVSFGAGIEDLRTELDDASKRLERARREAAAQASTALQTDDQVELARIAALERSAIALAENELFGGEYGAARRRLQKLLAQADRMNPSLRAEIEPRATFLIAKSYLDEARARQGGK